MSQQRGSRRNKRTKPEYGTGWRSRNVFGTSSCTPPMFLYRCDVCGYEETHTHKGVYYCATNGPDRHAAKRLRLVAVGSREVKE